jgi:dihydrofolate reductase
VTRKIIQFMSVSLDGYMEGPDRDIGWHRVDEELFDHMIEVLRPMGAFLEGRVSYQLMADFWPTADQEPGATAANTEFARIWREMPKIVYSRTLDHADWNSTVVREVVPQEVRALKAQPGGDLVLGGADLGAAFRELGLVDEYRIYVHPVLIGRGKPMFRPSDLLIPLRLTGTHAFGNGVVLLRYSQ